MGLQTLEDMLDYPSEWRLVDDSGAVKRYMPWYPPDIWESFHPPQPKIRIPRFPPSMHGMGPNRGTPWPYNGGSNINIWGEGEAPGFEDYAAAGPDFEEENHGRPSTGLIPDHSVDVIVIRSSPIKPETWDEICRICQENCTVTILGYCPDMTMKLRDFWTAMDRLGCARARATHIRPIPGPRPLPPEYSGPPISCAFHVRLGQCACCKNK